MLVKFCHTTLRNCTVSKVVQVLLTCRTLRGKSKVEYLRRAEDVPHIKTILKYTFNPYCVIHPKIKVSKKDLVPLTVLDHNEVQTLVSFLEEFFAPRNYLQQPEIFNTIQKEHPKLYPLMTRIVRKEIEGITNKTVNNAWEGTVPLFMPAKTTTDLCDVDFPVWGHFNYTGLRTIWISKNGNSRPFNVHGKPIQGLSGIRREVNKLSRFVGYDVVFDGYVINIKTHSVDPKHEKNLRFVPTDFVPLEGWRSGNSKYSTAHRIPLLEELIKDFLKNNQVVSIVHPTQKALQNEEEMHDLYLDALNHGENGLVLKCADATYQFGEGPAWNELNPNVRCEAKIVDIVEDTNTKTERAKLDRILANYNGNLIDVSNGFAPDEREALWSLRDELKGKTIEVLAQPNNRTQKLHFARFLRVLWNRTPTREIP